MKKRLKTTSLFLAAATLVGLSPTASAANDLTVAATETVNVTASQENSTVGVHGALTVSGGTKDSPVRLTVTEALNVGCADGDTATVTVGDYGQILGQASVTIGGPNGQGLVTVGGKRKGDIETANEDSYAGDSAHLFCGVITVPADATAESGTLDILRLDANGALVQNGANAKIQNLSSSCDARIRFNGGSLSDANGWSAAEQFASMGGRALVLESENKNPISLRYQYGAVCEPTEGLVKTAGAGDVVVTGKTWTESQGHYGWRLTAEQGFDWGHKGDLRLSAAMCLVCASANVLPCLEDGGDVVLDGDRSDNWLDLNGTAQAVNGLTATASSIVSNSAPTAATLTFGSARPDGTLNAPLVLGLVNVEKVGTGTLTITNTPTLAALTVTGGTVRFAPSDGLVNLSALTVAANAQVVIDSVTVRANALALIRPRRLTS